jgi:hypothetical protein
MKRQAIRFTDSRGIVWSVGAQRVRGAVLPLSGNEPAVLAYDDWLYFRSRDGTRRLAEFPDDWALLPPEDLERLLARARHART